MDILNIGSPSAEMQPLGVVAGASDHISMRKERGNVNQSQNDFGMGYSGFSNREESRLGLRSSRNGIQKFLPKINFDSVARGLVFASLGLGLVEVLMPHRVQKLVGVRRGDHTGLIRMLGIREIASALLIFSQARPVSGLWSRVAGDAMDLGLLFAAFNTPRARQQRVARTTAAIAGITALDVLTASQLSRKRRQEKHYSTLTSADLKGRAKNGAFHVTKSITINRSPEELYEFWRRFENLPKFMYHLESVQVIDDRRSRWTAKAPARTQVSWDAEIVEDEPNRLIAWRSLDGADVPNSGRIRFEPGPAGRGTVVTVEIEYRPPGGAIGKTVAALFGEEPTQQVKGDLNRFKQVVETGEVMRSDGSPAGLGQKMQRPARPSEDANKEERMPRSERDRQRSGVRNFEG